MVWGHLKNFGIFVTLTATVQHCYDLVSHTFELGSNTKLEKGESTKKLLDSLLVVRAPSIARWNEHKDVKEDKEREPFYFGGKPGLVTSSIFGSVCFLYY